MTSRADEYPRFTRPPSSAQQVSRDLSTAEALQLLTEARFGRIVYSRYALPTIRPVNHIVDGETIVVHAHRGSSLTTDRQVVAFEADTIDERTHRGWCVIVTGTAEPITDPQELARYRTLLRPWLPGPRDHMVRIQPDIITGIEYLDPDPV
ncbi:pyridoxamine 5'-phosphate oxidase family protein [Nocardia sp. CDC159]|uniref:Pyridoxamine 5'-phosphate oxidase family protein n=1 Tax=Nocardia pulmonis TaxID=2951408 RepID=A0A9X2EG82_9NOCA|nr:MULTISPECIES: pyridoxamine 5'-phosphate oxidase family protein [Nocardia]MCM6777613.1 pyridoxamine 5'-phosphate oxidase family protein [Nocardia pulmonis]MCM6790583.1 pyridoxamine 5'-phosphate oxidase family protein [Nocardia sp. CDC159]